MKVRFEFTWVEGTFSSCTLRVYDLLSDSSFMLSDQQILENMLVAVEAVTGWSARTKWARWFPPATLDISSLRVPVYTHAITQKYFVNRNIQRAPCVTGEPRESVQCFQELDAVFKTMDRKRATFSTAPTTSVYTCSAGSLGPHLATDLCRCTNKQEGHRHLDSGRTHNSPEEVYFTEELWCSSSETNKLLIHKTLRCHPKASVWKTEAGQNMENCPQQLAAQRSPRHRICFGRRLTGSVYLVSVRQ